MLFMITLKIDGDLMSKSNSRIMTTRGGRTRLIKKPKAIEYEESALWQLKGQLRGHVTFTRPVRLDVRVWYSSMRPDLDVSLLQDVLEKAGVYKNDRLVEEIHAHRFLDRENPRLEVTISDKEKGA